MHWNINPIAIHIGIIQIHWYGIFFALGLLGAYYVGEYIFKREKVDTKILENYFIYLIIGITIGARLFHVLFYDFDYFKKHPIEIVQVWKGGLASHGGILGALLASYIFCKRYHLNFWWLFSRAALGGLILAPFIRIGNFFNSEIVGTPTNLPWAVVFERVDQIPRHPVVLYEALGYFILFLLAFVLYHKISAKKFSQIGAGVIIVGVFLIRFFLEYFKTAQSEFAKILPLSMGQLLSIPFILAGVTIILFSSRKKL